MYAHTRVSVLVWRRVCLRSLCAILLLLTPFLLHRDLGMLIKHWAKQRKLNNPKQGTLSSYSWVMLLIHFLIRRKEQVCMLDRAA